MLKQPSFVIKSKRRFQTSFPMQRYSIAGQYWKCNWAETSLKIESSYGPGSVDEVTALLYK